MRDTFVDYWLSPKFHSNLFSDLTKSEVIFLYSDQIDPVFKEGLLD